MASWKIRKNVSEITIAAVLTAILILLRFISHSLLGVSFTAAVVIFTASFLSSRIAVYAGTCLYVITGFFLGFGIWVLFQVIAIAVIVAVTHFIPKNKRSLCIFAFASAFLYSFVMLFSALPFVPLPAIPAYVAAGLPNDVIHAVTSAAVMLVLHGSGLVRIFQNYRRTYLQETQD